MILSLKNKFVPAILAYLCFIALPMDATSQNPNIVVVFADDIGPGDIGFYHRERTGKKEVIPTPNMDKLIKEGIRFSDAHSPVSLCAPSRFCMLTGNYSYRNYRPFGVWPPYQDPGIDPKFTTSARIAKNAGYATAFFGKWGMGGQLKEKGTGKKIAWENKKNTDYSELVIGANHFGFDYACELPVGIQGEPFAFYENGKWMKLKDNSKLQTIDNIQNGYSTSRKHTTLSGIGDSNWDPSRAGPILISKAVGYIIRQTAQNPKQPFYIHYCTQAVHIPHVPPKELNGVKIAGSTPGAHADMVRELDVQVGMLIDALKKAGIYDNTLFILTSDNGGLNADPAAHKLGHDPSHGFRGAKSSIYEGGHRVPFIAVWPKVIKPNIESHEPIVGHDVVATLAAITKQSLHKSVKDSLNLMPLFTQQPGAKGHKIMMHQQQKRSDKQGPEYALRQGDWKLIMSAPKETNLNGLKSIALFNLKENPAELNGQNHLNKPEHKQRVQQMFETYKKLRSTGTPTVTP